jgi:hypothetical protein
MPAMVSPEFARPYTDDLWLLRPAVIDPPIAEPGYVSSLSLDHLGQSIQTKSMLCCNNLSVRHCCFVPVKCGDVATAGAVGLIVQVRQEVKPLDHFVRSRDADRFG